jgi:hypothetical protein
MLRSFAAIVVIAFALAASVDCSSSSPTSGKGGSGGGTAGGASGGANAGSGGAGAGGCGGAVCTASQICVHPQCLNCSIQPAPFCLDVPASCGGTPTCACFPFTVCERNGQAGGVCVTIDARGLVCG